LSALNLGTLSGAERAGGRAFEFGKVRAIENLLALSNHGTTSGQARRRGVLEGLCHVVHPKVRASSPCQVPELPEPWPAATASQALANAYRQWLADGPQGKYALQCV